MRNFPTHFWRAFQETKDAVAFVELSDGATAAETTYWEWTRRVQRLAVALLEEGFEPGTRLGLIARNRRDWLDLAFATWLVGGCVVPLVGDRRRGATLKRLARSGCEWIVVDDRDALDRLRGQGANIPEHLRWIVVDGERAPGEQAMALAELDARGRSLAVRGRVDQLAEHIYGLDADLQALILFDPQAGADADPHGAYFTGASLGRMLGWLGDDLQLDDGERVAAALSFGWFQALLPVAATLLAGRAVCMADGIGPLVDGLDVLEPTRLISGPAFLDGRTQKIRGELEQAPQFLQSAAADDAGAGGLVGLLGKAGESVARKLFYEPLRREFGAKLSTVYLVGGRLPDEVTDVLGRAKLTLCGLWGVPEAGVTHMERPGARRRGSVGRPVQGYAAKIAGAKTGEPGEVCVRSDTLFAGYWDGQGPHAVDEHGWLHTGVRGRIDSGYLFLG